MKAKRNGLLLTVLIGLMVSLVGCGDEPTSSPGGEVVVATQSAVGDATESTNKGDVSEEPSLEPTEEPEPEATEEPAPSETEEPEKTEEPKEPEKPKSNDKDAAYSDITGTYKLVATSLEDICVDVRNEPEVKGAKIVIKKDGTGSISYEGEKDKIKWKLKKNKLTLYSTDGTDLSLSSMGSIEEIVYENEMIIIKIDAEESGKGATYFARKKTDISWMNMISVEELQKMQEENSK